MSLNTVIISGHLTRDVEIKYTGKGTAVGDTAIAVNRHYTTQDGEKREEVAFVDITLWGRTAEIAGEFLKKGSYTSIVGYISQDTWDDKITGKKRSKLLVVVDKLELVPTGRKGGDPNEAPGAGERDRGGRTRNDNPPQQPPPVRRSAPPPPPPKDPDLDIFGDVDDIPF